ncbi:dihydroorotase [Faecalicatena sp. AGMB00832]|uniref:Dihydroorotase n=1 Tax=Faecalicatena faecalis TaxID=2726362 RepID=A0ABS6CZ44_9FIRM|nr:MULTISPECIES: dihydroorotase [Faecalicatena]MBU3874595.1 dihydroorotase [Faecalicatena faecalis]MCI6464792.1 dihydroorotase [Faecalicatena sp.]MDY5620006.1 dihydroorotase [Lachnospiraceae bacterium]
MRLLIQNGHVLDPLTGLDDISDVLVDGTKIVKVAKEIQDAADETIDASGCYVMPGLIDLHVHLRDPGLTHKETLETGGRAAARGGVTTVCAMPNTKPITDTKEMVEELHKRAAEESPIHVIQLGAVTKGEKGEELADIEGMAKAGCHAISEDGKSVMNAALYRKGMKLAKECGISVFAHCEDINMVEGGVMNAGAKAEALGVKGITNSVEDVIVARDILLAKETGVRLHLCHCSTADSVKMIDAAKKAGLLVTGEVCPHHFILSDEDIKENDGQFKMNPPLRSKEDVEALREGLKNGIMDVISTDHAPHAEEEKNLPMEKASFGIVGLETSACLTYTELVEKGVLTPMQMAEKMSYNPARILGLSDKGSVSEGMTADLMVFDPAAEYRIDKNTFLSKGKNTPFDGYPVKGEVRYTIVDGRIVYAR